MVEFQIQLELDWLITCWTLKAKVQTSNVFTNYHHLKGH